MMERGASWLFALSVMLGSFMAGYGVARWALTR